MTRSKSNIRELLSLIAKFNNEAESHDKKAMAAREKAKNIQATIDIISSENSSQLNVFAGLDMTAEVLPKPKARGPRMSEKTLGLIRFVDNQQEASIQQIRDYLQVFGPLKDDSLRSQLSNYSKDKVFDKPRKGYYAIGPKGREILDNDEQSGGVL